MFLLKKPLQKMHIGFTLAELLISLAILGVIATFTIPKILVSQQNQQFNATGKETMAMISAAFQLAQMNGQVSASMQASALTTYMNYLNVDTTSSIDCGYGATCTTPCGTLFGGSQCLTLHNGGKLLIPNNNSFAGSTTTNILIFYFDPDGKVTESTPTATGPGKTAEWHLFYNGLLTTRDSSKFNRCNSLACPLTPTSGNDPPWLTF